MEPTEPIRSQSRTNVRTVLRVQRAELPIPKRIMEGRGVTMVEVQEGMSELVIAPKQLGTEHVQTTPDRRASIWQRIRELELEEKSPIEQKDCRGIPPVLPRAQVFDLEQPNVDSLLKHAAGKKDRFAPGMDPESLFILVPRGRGEGLGKGNRRASIPGPRAPGPRLGRPRKH
jgi:hypothetical protein